MNQYDFKEALEKKKNHSFSAGPSLIFKELEAAEEAIRLTEVLLKNKKP